MSLRPGRLVRATSLLVAFSLFTACVSASTASAVGFSTTTSTDVALAASTTGLDKIQHFVFIMQENHSFDSYFGTYPGADGLPAGVCVPSPHGDCIAPYHNSNPVNHGGPHDWANAHADIDNGQMDGFVTQAYQGMSRQGISCSLIQAKCAPGRDPRDVMGYHDYHEIPNYWNYAHLYVLQDRMFSSVPSYTLPNRLYSLAAQSGGLLRLNQPKPKSLDFPEITELLTSKGIDWKYYVTVGKQIDLRNGHVVAPGSTLVPLPDQFSYYNPLPAFAQVLNDPHERSRLVETSQFYVDAETGHLPAVSWVVPNDVVSEHPPSDIRVGEAYVTGLVDAVMEGPDWDSTAIFISYDEWGGFYDHVVPPTVDGVQLGLRVPGLVISPYAKEGYVDHHVYSPASWLRIVEERFGLAPMTARDATANDMLDAFDFSQNPRPPVILAPTLQGSPYPQPLQVITWNQGLTASWQARQLTTFTEAETNLTRKLTEVAGQLVRLAGLVRGMP
ncbi:MAG TPA: alkaline phosphatase family protein [Chloroflexota bacterium]|nr:alkaline phosphatase family protein [Chloroflexota bacterium]